jgi:hypothetical protein
LMADGHTMEMPMCGAMDTGQRQDRVWFGLAVTGAIVVVDGLGFPVTGDAGINFF